MTELTAYCPDCRRLVPYAIVARHGPALVPLRGDKGLKMMFTEEDAPGEKVAVSCADCLYGEKPNKEWEFDWKIVRPRREA